MRHLLTLRREQFRTKESLIFFQALGNLYFISKSVKSLKTWNFLTHEWEPVDGKNIHTGNIETVPTKEKSKFPQNFFPEVCLKKKNKIINF